MDPSGLSHRIYLAHLLNIKPALYRFEVNLDSHACTPLYCLYFPSLNRRLLLLGFFGELHRELTQFRELACPAASLPKTNHPCPRYPAFEMSNLKVLLVQQLIDFSRFNCKAPYHNRERNRAVVVRDTNVLWMKWGQRPFVIDTNHSRDMSAPPLPRD